MSLVKYETLYNLDSKGKVRVWWMEREVEKYRTVSGIEDGNLVTSEWKVAHGKNVGKKNETQDWEQADLEIHAIYIKKLDNKYYRDRDSVGSYKYFKAMLAEKWSDRKDKLPEGVDLWSQPKLDGYRCIISKDGALTRGGKPFLCIPHILEALKPVFDLYPDAVFDGELYNHDLRDNFNEIGSIIKQMKPTQEDLDKSKKFAQFHVYDMPSVEGKFSARHYKLQSVFLDIASDAPIKMVQTKLVTDGQSSEILDQLYGEYLADGYEGQMIRVDDANYESGKRSKSLLKRKEFFDAEFEVISLEEGQGNWAGYAKAVYFRMPDGRKTKGGDDPRAGIKGSQEFTKALLNGPRPKYVTIRYPNLTPDGIPRFPIAVDFYEKERDV